jgi:hypothetical protein
MHFLPHGVYLRSPPDGEVWRSARFEFVGLGFVWVRGEVVLSTRGEAVAPGWLLVIPYWAILVVFAIPLERLSGQCTQ